MDASGTWWSCGATDPPSTRRPAASAFRTAARISRVLPRPAEPDRNRVRPWPWPASSIRWSIRSRTSSRPRITGQRHRSRALHGAQCRPARSRAVIGRSTDEVRRLRAPRWRLRSYHPGNRFARPDAHPRHDPDGSEGAPPRPSRRRPPARDGRRSRAEYGYDGLPTTDVDELAAWFRRGADRKSLELYLETFPTPFGVMQERDAIIRVAAECAEDLAADGVVYAEVRYAPELSTERGLTLDEVVEANLEGFRIGMERAAAAGHPIVDEDARDRDAPGGPLGRGRRVRDPLARRRASSGSTSPAPRRATRRPATSTRSTGSGARTSTSRSMPASRSGCRPSGRRSSSRAPSGSATASGSSTTSPSSPTARSSSAGWRRSSATGGCRSRCARPRTSTPAPPTRSRDHPIDLLRRLRFRVTRQHRQPADERRLDVVASSPRSTRPSGSASARWSG